MYANAARQARRKEKPSDTICRSFIGPTPGNEHHFGETAAKVWANLSDSREISEYIISYPLIGRHMALNRIMPVVVCGYMTGSARRFRDGSRHVYYRVNLLSHEGFVWE